MTDVDAREKAARFYDLSPGNPNEDIACYRERLPSTEASVLELGCGTGRVLIPLSESCSCIHGVDASDPMITICREKLAERGRPPSKVNVETGDIRVRGGAGVQWTPPGPKAPVLPPCAVCGRSRRPS